MDMSKVLMKTKYLFDVVLSSCAILTSHSTLCRGYKKGVNDDGCKRACVDVPPDPNTVCPEPCNRWGKKKDSILHKIKLKIIEGGTNFGTPFRRLQCKEKVCKEMEIPEPKALPAPSKKVPPLPPPRPGVQVSVLGADTNLGQYIALLLKQCPCIKKLRLYEARDTQFSECNRDLCKVVQDIQHIDTNCIVQAYSCVCNELDKCLQNDSIPWILVGSKEVHVTQHLLKKKYVDCLFIVLEKTKAIGEHNSAIHFLCGIFKQASEGGDLSLLPINTVNDHPQNLALLYNSDIVLILENGCVSMDMPLEDRFNYQAPIIKQYGDAIAKECPNAFIVVCASPIDCMVPLIAETLKETGWYNPRKLLGSLAVPEMRASTLAARALCLEPSYVHVPCVGGTEGPSLVPLFSRALDYFDFSEQNSGMMTQAVRSAPLAVSRYDGNCARAAELSEAHALTGLVTKVAWALLCKDVPRVTGFVETDASQVISPSRFIANTVEITGTGIIRSMGLPKMSDVEIKRVDIAVNKLYSKHKMVYDWYSKYFSSSGNLDAYQLQFFKPKSYERFDDCAYATI